LRRRYDRVADFENLCRISNELNYEIKAVRKRNFQSSINKRQKNFLSHVKSVTKGVSQNVFSIVKDDRLVTSPKDISEVFAEFFLDKVQLLSNNSCPSHFVIPDIFSSPTLESDYFIEDVLKKV